MWYCNKAPFRRYWQIRSMCSWALAPQFVTLCVRFPSSACANKYPFRAAVPTLQNLRAVFVISRIESGVLYFRAFPTVSREHVTCTRGACGCLLALTLLTALPPGWRQTLGLVIALFCGIRAQKRNVFFSEREVFNLRKLFICVVSCYAHRSTIAQHKQ